MSVVRPAILAVMLRRAPVEGILTFCQRFVFSKKQATVNATGADVELSYTDVSMVKRRGPEGSPVPSPAAGTDPITVTMGHHCPGRYRRYSSKSETSPGCLERSARARSTCDGDAPHQAEGMDGDLQDAAWGLSGGEAAVTIKERVRSVEVSLFSCQVGTDSGVDGVDVDIRAVETVLLKDINVGLYLDIVGCVLPTRVFGDGVDKVAQVDGTREDRLRRHGEERWRAWKRMGRGKNLVATRKSYKNSPQISDTPPLLRCYML